MIRDGTVGEADEGSGGLPDLQRAMAAARRGDHAGAAAIVDGRSLAASPDLSVAGAAGVILQMAGRDADAEPALVRACARPDAPPDPLGHLGAIRLAQKRPAEAATLFRRALAARPVWPAVAYNLGSALLELKDPKQATAAYLLAVRQQPAMMEAWNGAGLAFAARERFDEACRHYAEALRLRPTSAAVLNNLGVAHRALGKPQRSLEIYRRCLELAPESPEFLNNLGVAHESLGQVDEATACYRRAIAARPGYAEAHAHLGIALLLSGRLAEAWPEYEWRWRVPELAPARRSYPDAPQWSGEPLDGRTILLHSEQGLGDTIQFVRFAPLLAARGARVLVEAPATLAPLIRDLPGVAGVVARGAQAGEPFHFHCPMLSVPGALGTTVETIPSAKAYLKPDPARVDAVAARLGARDGRLRVGLVWAGNPRHRNDRNRSCEPARLAALASVPDVRWISLQKPEGKTVAMTPPPGLAVESAFIDACRDFADTAALVSQLDVVVGVDTSVMHLAGALGVPAWVLLPVLPDWRWMLGRDDSPWYPSARLYRQETVGLWEPVVERVAADLAARAGRPLPVDDRPPRFTLVLTRADAAALAWLERSKDLARHARVIVTTDRADAATREALDALRDRLPVDATLDVPEGFADGRRGFRAALALARTPYVLWVDRDVSFSEPDWPRVFDRFVRTSGPFEVAGHRAFHRRTMKYQGFVERRPWWRGVTGYRPGEVRRVPFALGGCLFVRTAFAREHDFPDGFDDPGRLDAALGDLVAHVPGARLTAFPWHVTRCFDWTTAPPVEPANPVVEPQTRDATAGPTPVPDALPSVRVATRPRRRLVIGITTAAGFESRQAMSRAGWLRQLAGRDDVEAFFVRAGERFERVGDELRVPVSDRVCDMYSKVRHLCRYALDAFDAPFVFKCDDDTFVHVARLLAFAEGGGGATGYAGFNHGRTGNVVDYAHGGAGVLLGRTACERLATHAFVDGSAAHMIDDMRIGAQLKAAGVALRHDDRFVRQFHATRCPSPMNDSITAHGVTERRRLDHLLSLWPDGLAT